MGVCEAPITGEPEKEKEIYLSQLLWRHHVRNRTTFTLEAYSSKDAGAIEKKKMLTKQNKQSITESRTR